MPRGHLRNLLNITVSRTVGTSLPRVGWIGVEWLTNASLN